VYLTGRAIDYFSYYKDYASLSTSASMSGRVFFTFYESMQVLAHPSL
jgi:hypothetical protein